MPFFGQVWVWSLAGFLVGALLCWLLIANPARKRVEVLKDKLAVAARKPEQAPERRDTDFGDRLSEGGFQRYQSSSVVSDDDDDEDEQVPAKRDDTYDRSPERDDAHESTERAEPYGVDRDGHDADRDVVDPDDHHQEQRPAPRLSKPPRGTGFHAGNLDGSLFAQPEPAEHDTELAAETTQYIPAARTAAPVEPHEPVEAPPEVVPERDRREWYSGDDHLIDD
ncbi:MAG: hypothetical protein M3548_05015, partial [Actinomycetota bacterium]|nr:hypothetical protein [Actinomycetota bacterium]